MTTTEVNDTRTHTLTVPQTCERLNVSRSTVQRWIASGDLRVVRFGRLVRVPLDELRRLARDGVPA
jgi:excisionase family DNA binding protein